MKPKAALKRTAARIVRGLLLRYMRAAPRGPERIYIVLTTAYGMGGTIRTVLNLAGHLAKQHEVVLVSVGRGRAEPFFELPPGVTVTTLEDKRPSAKRSLPHRLLGSRSSVLMHRDDRAWKGFNLWVDIQLARRLHRARGYLVTTRPGLNFIAALARPPGLVLVGQEHMHFNEHKPSIRKAMRAHYPKLDVLVVLTEGDRESYERHLGDGARVVRIPNTVRDMGGGRADLRARTAITAGRFSPQKGYDMLIPAWAEVAERHPDWRLRIFGDGPKREQLEGLVAEHGLDGTVSLEKPAKDLGAEMERASIYVLSSRFEGLPLVLLEAMSKGMAVVSFDCPTGPADVIEDRRNGILVPPKRVKLLAEAISEVIEHDELRRACADGAVATAREYSMDAIGPRWDALLAELRPARG